VSHTGKRDSKTNKLQMERRKADEINLKKIKIEEMKNRKRVKQKNRNKLK
jgi:hypothetical protein